MTYLLSSTALMFADHLKLFFRGTTNSLDQLQQNLINLELWNTQNHLLFNAKKCNMLVFNFQIPPFLKFMGNVLSDINSVKDLGLTLNKALKWSEHINNKLSKCHKVYHTKCLNAILLLF